MGYVYIALTVLLTVYGQLVLKWLVNQAGSMPATLTGKGTFLLGIVLSPWALSAFLSAFLASLAWMAAMTRFQLSYAYPFMSLNFVLVLLLSVWFFQEPLTLPKVVGLAFIVLGITIGSQG
jgi:multidrug transporter EmrE-like cation transporter